MKSTPDTRYFEHARDDLLALLPLRFWPKTVLDVGCGAGVSGERLKTRYDAQRVVGIERNRDAAEQARSRLDEVIEKDVESESWRAKNGEFDLILFGDVLEHLLDPWSVLRRFRRFLAVDGVVLASIPNVQHWRNVLRLLRGNWDYREGGTLDRSHLRFFTKHSVERLFYQAGLRIEEWAYGMGSEVRFFDTLTLHGLRNFLAYQFLVRAGARNPENLRATRRNGIGESEDSV